MLWGRRGLAAPLALMQTSSHLQVELGSAFQCIVPVVGGSLGVVDVLWGLGGDLVDDNVRLMCMAEKKMFVAGLSAAKVVGLVELGCVRHLPSLSGTAVGVFVRVPGSYESAGSTLVQGLGQNGTSPRHLWGHAVGLGLVPM